MTGEQSHSEFQELLSAALRRVHMGKIRARLSSALENGLLAVGLVAGLFASIRLVGVLLGGVEALGWAWFWIGSVIGFVAGVVATLTGVVREKPTLRDVAERLDLATSDHNRIAIALSLAEGGVGGVFALAAIQDGKSALRRLKDQHPVSEMVSIGWRRLGMLSVAIFGLVAVAFVSGFGCGLGNEVGGGPVATNNGPSDRVASALVEPKEKEEVKPPGIVQKPQAEGQNQSRVGQTSDQASEKNKQDPSSGRTSVGSAGEAKSSDQSASTSGESTSSSAPSDSKEKPGSKQKKSKPSKETKMKGNKESNAPQQSSSVSKGSGGGGTMSPVQHDWSQRATSADSEQEDEENDDEVEDEKESSRQRGGIQPSLKDRNEAPSRDLGIPGEQGPPGAGRGGPTPPKKSRGTASVVLGVPVPDFVKGRLSPGTTKITHERVEPTAMAGDASAPVAVESRTEPEEPVKRPTIPPDLSAFVREYLIALHSSDKAESAESAEVKE